ncbi:hypothetical protein V6N12_016057 [Hibiscus sabdariffa]|uniref:Uncharacterized protein n=1 Tax=Hibiscus sabdariffa TaxID=183260 RepID=A0ABR2AMF3_9ROSI
MAESKFDKGSFGKEDEGKAMWHHAWLAWIVRSRNAYLPSSTEVTPATTCDVASLQGCMHRPKTGCIPIVFNSLGQ